MSSANTPNSIYTLPSASFVPGGDNIHRDTLASREDNNTSTDSDSANNNSYINNNTSTNSKSANDNSNIVLS